MYFKQISQRTNPSDFRFNARPPAKEYPLPTSNKHIDRALHSAFNEQSTTKYSTFSAAGLSVS